MKMEPPYRAANREHVPICPAVFLSAQLFEADIFLADGRGPPHIVVWQNSYNLL